MTDLVAQFPAAPASPSGTVTFTGAPSTFPTNCNIVSGTCSFSYTPTAGSEGAYSALEATFAGSTSLTTSSGTTSLTISTATTTALNCTNNPAVIGVSDSCTVTVSNNDGSYSTPAIGTVTFSGAPTGFPANCPLSSGTCTFSFTPSGSSGSFTITANYGGDTTHQASSGTLHLTVNAALAVTASASLATIDQGQSSTITATATGGSGTYSTYSFYATTCTSTALQTGSSNSYTTSALSGTTTYCVEVTDSLSDTATTTVVVTVNAALSLSASASPSTIDSGQASTITATATGRIGQLYLRFLFFNLHRQSASELLLCELRNRRAVYNLDVLCRSH